MSKEPRLPDPNEVQKYYDKERRECQNLAEALIPGEGPAPMPGAFLTAPGGILAVTHSDDGKVRVVLPNGHSVTAHTYDHLYMDGQAWPDGSPLLTKGQRAHRLAALMSRRIYGLNEPQMLTIKSLDGIVQIPDED